MIELIVSPDMEAGPWRDLPPRKISHGQIERVGLMPGGVVGGRPSLEIAVRQYRNGRIVIGGIPWAIWRPAMIALWTSPVAEWDLIENPEPS